MSHIKLHRRPNPKTNLKAKTNPNRNLQKTEKKLEKRKKIIASRTRTRAVQCEHRMPLSHQGS